LATPTQRARQALTQRLRELRRRSGATGAEFAAQLGNGWGQPRVSKIETGRQLPTAADVNAWAAATNADPDELLDLLEHARIEYATFRERYTDLAGADRLQGAIAAAETAATRITYYDPMLIPGILQTADYARELLHLPSGPAQSGATDEEINRMIASRIRRQAILYEPGRDITLLVGEAGLRTRVASPATMRTQLDHLARLAETLTTANIGIVPFSAQAPIATLNGWGITDDLVTVETDAGNIEIADPEHVHRYWHHTRLLLDVAVIGEDAARLCRHISSEINEASAAA
jgi:transcriptional regulator with XRE-family HTH domain